MAETVGFFLLAGATVETAAGVSAIGALTIAGTGVTVATVVGTAAILGASLAVSYATRPDVPSPNDGTQTMKQAVAPRPFGYGRSRLAGSFVLFEASDDGTFSYDVMALHQGKIVGIVHHFLNEDLVLLGPGDDGSGQVLAASSSNGNIYGLTGVGVLFHSRLGLPTETAYADIVSALPNLWTDEHRGDGLASLALVCKSPNDVANFPKNFPRGLPKPSVVADLSAVFDPRGPAHVREDPDTWEISSNPVLILLDYLTHFERGPALDWDAVIEPRIDALMAEADICDELVVRADGSTEPRYASNGWAYLTTDPAEVISAILASCDGWMCEAGDGTLALRVGKYAAPAVTLTDDHIIGFTIDKGVADEDLVNEIQWSFVAPGNDFREAAGVPWRDEDAIAEQGTVRTTRQALTWVHSHSQGRRLVKRRMAREQALARGTMKVSLYGIRILGQRFVRVQSGETDELADAVVEIASKLRVDLSSGTVTFDWLLVNPNSIDAWDEDEEEGDAPAFDSKLTPLPLEPLWVKAGSTIRVTIEEPLWDARTDLTFAIEYKLTSADTWTRQVLSAVDIGGNWQITTSAVAAGTYDVRVASVGAGAGGALSPWTTVESVNV